MKSPEPACATAIEAAPAPPAADSGFELFIVDTRGAPQRLRVTGVSAPPEPAAETDALIFLMAPGEAGAPFGAPEIRRIAVAMGNVDGIGAPTVHTDK